MNQQIQQRQLKTTQTFFPNHFKVYTNFVN